MGTVLRDYFALNRARVRTAFGVIFFCMSAGQIVLNAQRYPNYGTARVIALDVVSVIFWAIGVALFVILVGALDAYLRARRLSLGTGTSIEEYVKTAAYLEHGRDQLRRTDKPRKWV
ncbi:MAG TPA: hypothetical protein VNW15_05000 [Rhizomicrobium sp.]|jgi:hypothetical protein|nr:hypothetical protein [Rhizomicrobium sp.]